MIEVPAETRTLLPSTERLTSSALAQGGVP
jgi:hypothetical protein